ncbi:Phycobilisome linker polypeptide [Trichormus variabilis ATCC 29413]|uniref:Phycobilisome linker polypeptide n=2 Tax=Anabaena variabilis TaxID=264691 RepID=Q3M8Y7_TRIV2|nr:MULTISPECIES: phycobilisome rod-core linker polypeptide [Nostocaceae]ABA22549.1 Phycobilisome linker polypeptide [Trichormus variabilis ATCC 29413]MBC1212980.1 phycobilisome rod-core linker polypeptide [Trichormus variabilis ARAD]MBC1254624.1 phycobilisome rod-core linker polypeptide [Trichormus variabilis V5]MBC1265927.1 phycobilisome rod-core linker polypeptide [Trichormus variabilis FSR]MBC1300966.1 phycobilisome rod-core linker polypeptide [Trichormus variabilis N2B]
MALPLLEYKPTTQNQRVQSFGTADVNEDTPYIYRLEDANSPSEIEELIWAAYRQVFNEQEILKFNRQIGLETQLKNRSITVKDFIRGLAKSERFYQLVVTPNNNYRLVEMSLKRLLGRSPYNEEEKIAWSIQIASKGWGGFVDALIDSTEYEQAFGDNAVPYQRKRLTTDRPFSFTPRYGADYRDRAGIVRPGRMSNWNNSANQNYDGMAILGVLLAISTGLTFLFVLNWLGISSSF